MLKTVFGVLVSSASDGDQDNIFQRPRLSQGSLNSLGVVNSKSFILNIHLFHSQAEIQYIVNCLKLVIDYYDQLQRHFQFDVKDQSFKIASASDAGDSLYNELSSPQLAHQDLSIDGLKK